MKVLEAKQDLSRLIQRAIAGEEIIIADGETPLVRLVAVKPVARQRTLDAAAGQVRMSDDFDAPLPDFDGYR